MLKEVKRNLYRSNTLLLLSFLCATPVAANAYEQPKTALEVLTASVAPAPFVQLHDFARMAITGFSTAFSAVRPSFDAPVLAASVNPTRTDGIRSGERSGAGTDTLTTASITSTDYSVRRNAPLFGAHRIRFGKINSGVKISQLIRKAAASSTSAMCVGRCAALADSLGDKSQSIDEQLRRVSRSVNHMIAYKTDAQTHGRLDYWSTPNETLKRGGGDCEDYAILKMALLSRIGVPLNSMELVVVKDTSRRLFHAVLSVSVNGRSLILDNMTDAVETDTVKWNYAPLFSISGSANYVFGYKSGQRKLVASLGELNSVAPGAGF